MMGLLDDISDNFSSMDPNRRDAMNQGLLSMGLHMLATPGRFGQQLGAGGLAGLGAYQGALQQQRQNKAADMQQQMLKMQLDQHMRDQARQKQLDALPGQFYRSPAQQALANGGGPTVGNAERMGGMQPQFDAEGYGRALMAVDPQAGLAWQQANAKSGPKLKDVKVMAGPDGKPVQVQVFEDGQVRALPFGAAPDVVEVGTGDRKMLVDKNTGRQIGAWSVGASPDAVLSAGTTRRGQDITAGTAQRGQDLDALGRQNEIVYQTDPATGQLVAVPKQMQPGGVRPIPISQGSAGSKDAREALALVDQAEALLRSGKATGSGAGALYDQGAAWLGKSTDGAQISAQLATIGGMLTAKMPKMSGPQSDKDVALYREMAGAVADASKPVQTRLAALQTVREIQSRYANPQDGTSSPAPAATPAALPRPMAGMVRGGYKLKAGGNPADPNAWEPVR